MSDAYEGWAVVELFGHRTLAGQVSEVQQYGGSMMRIDVYEGEGDQPVATRYHGASAVYGLTPCTEETARRIAGVKKAQAPVQPWELPRLPMHDVSDTDPDWQDPEPD